MRNNNIKIGWAVAETSLDIPAYRRRVGYYLKKRGIQWEIAENQKQYDLVIVHHSADITVWKDYDKAKIVLDYNDDYLSGPRRGFRDLARGLAKYVVRQWARLELDYRKAYTNMMRRANAIVCCTDAQEAEAKKYCSNVHKIMDFQSDDDWMEKKAYNSGSTFNIVWEGLPAFEGLVKLSPVLRSFQDKNNSALHLITSLKHERYLRKYGLVHVMDVVRKKVHVNRVFLYEWNKYLFSHIVASCDLAIIPIDMNIPFWVYKPANKLLFFWRIGMPTLVDPTPEYVKAMNECGLDMVCHSADEWMENLNKYSLDSAARQKAGIQGKLFVDQIYSEAKLLERWDKVIDSIL